MTRRNILILDCTPLNEPREGQLLKRFFQICRLYKPARATSLYYPIRSKTDLLKKLNTGKSYEIIHISAHGSKSGSRTPSIGNGSTWSVGPKDIEPTNHTANLVFVNACSANSRKMADAFRCEVFLAPSTEVRWDDAALFSLVFYKRKIVDGTSVRAAFNFARKHTKTGMDYLDYWREG